MTTYKLDFPDGGVGYAERLTALSTRAWTGYNANSEAWRLAFYRSVLNHPSGARALCVLRALSPEGKLQDCGFVSVFPILPPLAKLQLRGAIDQYTYDESCLADPTAPGTSYHYVQSLYLDEAHRAPLSARRAVRAAVLGCLAGQRCGAAGRPFLIYAEAGYRRGREICENYGMAPSETRSYHDRPVYVLDSAAPSGPTARKMIDVIRAAG